VRLSEVGPEPPTDLGMLSLDSDWRETVLLQTPFFERNGEVSPDGRWLAYESNESGQFEVFVRPFPAVDEGRWQVSTAGGRRPSWARNGRELFYVAPDGAIMGMRIERITGDAPFAAGVPVQLVAGDGYYYAWQSPQQGRTYDVSHNDERFLRIKTYDRKSESAGPASRVVVVQNWFNELKRLAPTK
jgi:eukaryotic-like serine/threonine-protein kinase